MMSFDMCAGLEDMVHVPASRNLTDESLVVCPMHGGRAVGECWWGVLDGSMHGRWTQPCVNVTYLPAMAW